MTVFMVDRHLKGIRMEDLAAAQRAAIKTAAEMTADGKPMRYIRSTFLPEEGRCMCLVEGPSVTDVREMNTRAALPFTSIVVALDLTP